MDYQADEGQDSNTSDDTLLQDVVYAIVSVMAGAKEWQVGGKVGPWHPFVSTNYTFSEAQLFDAAQAMFGTTDDVMAEVTQQARTRESATGSIVVTVHEGRVSWKRDRRNMQTLTRTNDSIRYKETADLSARKDSTSCNYNPWKDTTTKAHVTIRTPHQLPLDTPALRPVNLHWDHTCSLDIKNHEEDWLYFQFWKSVEKENTLTADIGPIINVVETPIQTELVSDFRLPIKDVLVKEIKGWHDFEIIKCDSETDIESVKMKITSYVNFEADVTIKEQAYYKLLKKILQYETSNLEVSGNSLWKGEIAPELAAILIQFAALHNVRESTRKAFWYRAVSECPKVDNEYAFSLMKELHDFVALKLFSAEDLCIIQEALILDQNMCCTKIMSLHEYFPISWNESEKQLTIMLQRMLYLHKKADVSCLLYRIKKTLIQEDIDNQLQGFGLEWIRRLQGATIKKAKTGKEKIKAMDTLTTETIWLLREPSVLYADVFQKVMKLYYFKPVYLTVVREMMNILKPEISSLCLALDESSFTEVEEDEYDFGIGSDLLKVYKNLCLIDSIGNTSESLNDELDISVYHKWFIPAIMHWIRHTRTIAMDLLKKAISEDDFTPIDATATFSSSAFKMIGIFYNLKTWWGNVTWQDQDTKNSLTEVIVKELCDIALYYCQQLHKCLDSDLIKESNSLLKVAGAVANMEHVWNKLSTLSTIFGLGDMDDLNANFSSHGENVNNFIKNAKADVRLEVCSFLDTIAEKLSPMLTNKLDEACRTGSASVMTTFFDPILEVLNKRLNANCFKDFLERFWNRIINTFMIKLTNDRKRKKSDHFNKMYDILGAMLNFLTPEGSELDKVQAKTPGYISVVEELELLRMDSNHLIIHYYKERRLEADLQERAAEVVIGAHISDEENLNVSVYMAKDMHDPEATPGRLPAFVVKLELLPFNWFRTPAYETQALRDDPAVYNKDFEFKGLTTENIEKGILLIRLIVNHTLQSNVFIGEESVPLANLPRMAGSPPMYLKMTAPKHDTKYRPLEILRERGDEMKILKMYKRKISSAPVQ